MLIRMRRLFIFLLTGLFALTACQPDIHFLPESFQSPTADISGGDTDVSLVFPADAGFASLGFESNQDWTVSFVNDRAKEWCSIPFESGRKGAFTLTVSVASNEDYDERSASIVLSCGDLRRTIVVTQKQRDALLLSPGRVELPQAGGGFTIEVTANVDYSVSLPSQYPWLHAVGTKGLVTTTRAFQADANPNVEPRQAFVTVSSATGSEMVAVYQAGEEPALVISTSTVDIPTDGGTFEVQVTSNLNVEIGMQPASCDWVEELQTKTYSTNTYWFAVAPNGTRDAREMALIFRNEKYGLSDTVHVRQPYLPILLSDAEVELPGRDVAFAVKVDGVQPEEYNVTLSHRWLWMGEREVGDGFTLIWLRAQAYEGEEPREGFITLERKGVSRVDSVTVTQYPQLPGFSFSTALREVKAPELDGKTTDAWILWGDGTFERYAAGLTHRYAEPGWHDVWVEGRSLAPFLLPAPEDGMKIDFSGLKTEEEGE